MHAKFLSIISCAILMSVTQMASAESFTLEQRVTRMENLLANQADQAQKFEQLRSELAEMREMLEKQSYELEQIKQRQRNLYQDMDRRLNELEAVKQSSGMAAPVAPVALVAAPAVSAASDNVITADGDTEGKAAYDKAFGLLKDGRYAPAIAGHPPILYLPPPRQALHIPSSQYDLKPTIKMSLSRYPGDLVDQVHVPVPEHARQMSILPKPSQALHLTNEAPTLPISICLPQYMQYAFGEFSGSSKSAPHLGQIAGTSFT